MGGSTSTREVTMPEFQQNYIEGVVMPRAQQVANIPYKAYTGQYVGPLSSFTREAGDVYRNIATTGAEGLAANARALYNPYQQNVIDASLAQMQRQQEQALTGLEANIVRGGAFNAGRRGIAEAEFAAQNLANQNQMIANMMQQGYTQAQAAAMAQQQAQAGAAGGMATIGGAEQSLSQTDLAARYAEFLREQGYPLQQLGALATGASAIPPGLGTTTTTENTGFGGILGAIGAAGQAISMFPFSDPRLKDDIEHVATSNGIKYYRWKWNDHAKRIGADDTPPFGVMADEIKAIYPDLVHTGSDGYMRVDYAGLAERQGAQ